MLRLRKCFEELLTISSAMPASAGVPVTSENALCGMFRSARARKTGAG